MTGSQLAGLVHVQVGVLAPAHRGPRAIATGLPDPAFSGHDRKSLGNPYATSSSYFFSLREAVYDASFPPVTSNPSNAEETTAAFISAIGANTPGTQSLVLTCSRSANDLLI